MFTYTRLCFISKRSEVSVLVDIKNRQKSNAKKRSLKLKQIKKATTKTIQYSSKMATC